ncbi:histidinol-phosphatase [Geodermatophilus dictyosporus]|uniref:Histidinol-phosphatase n=1 Tax=Geodermatophilus dictyosporus TaxID=1523247 RepID=A0A1I5PI28_9ACTN|nr:histidinol-phosphatase [Geodermatophilus dictyosporus]
MEADDDLRLAFDAAGRVGELALAHFRSGVPATRKADGSPVTAADLAVERLLRETLSQARSGDAFLGEESGRLGDSDRVRILDPLAAPASSAGVIRTGGSTSRRRSGDHGGRRRRLPGAAVLLVGDPGVGPSSRPGPARTPGPGACRSARPRCSPARCSTPWTTSPGPGSHPVLGAPGSPLPLVELVRGEIDGFLAERHHTWDHAPWILIVEEAGGRFTDLTGGRASDRGGGLYSNAALRGQLLTALHSPAAP